MKKLFAAIIVVGGLGGYAYFSRAQGAQLITSTIDSSDSASLAAPTQESVSSDPGTGTNTNSASHKTINANPKVTIHQSPQTAVNVPKPTATPTPISAGQYKDGTYSGDAVDAVYGIVQVSAVVNGGRLTDVKILRSPSGREQTSEISSHSIPVFVREAIAAQSTKIDGMSGATQTFEGFRDSLKSALIQAKT